MRLGDITVEVRDRNLMRVGLVRPEELRLAVDELHNNVGTWTLTVPVEHVLAERLREPGAGIIVTGPDGTLLSGPVIQPEQAASVTDPAGTLTVGGVTDSVLLADALAYPQPGNPDPTTQTVAHDTRAGTVESIMHGFVAANIGPAAPPARRGGLAGGLTMGADLGRGPVTVKSSRFVVLGNLLAELASVADLGFRIVQRGQVLVFETYQVADRTTTVRLDIGNNTLSSSRVAVAAPGATQVIVAGQQEGTARQFVHLTTPAATTAEQAWGRRIEKFVDQRNTSDLDELRQAGNELLAAEGDTSVTVQVKPADDTSMDFGHAWGLGDRITVVAAGREYAAVVTGYALRADDAGFRLGAVLGDPAALDPAAHAQRAAASTENRLAALERTTPQISSSWRPADFVAPYLMFGDEGPRYRIAGDVVELRGYFAFTDQTPAPDPDDDGFLVLAHGLPDELLPREVQNAPCAIAGPGLLAQFEAAPGGWGLYLPAGLPEWVDLTGLRYLNS